MLDHVGQEAGQTEGTLVARAPGQDRLPRLLFVGLNPPLTSGARTRGRVDMARGLLGFATVEFVNLFAWPTRDLAGIAAVGTVHDGWREARLKLFKALHAADGVLFGYGVQAPTGVAGGHFRSQLAWLDTVMGDTNVPVWEVGGRPRHPSRWQRHTSRVHPDRPFREALAYELQRRNCPPEGQPPAAF